MNEQVNLCLHPFPRGLDCSVKQRRWKRWHTERIRLVLEISPPGASGPLGVPWLWVVVWTQLDLIMVFKGDICLRRVCGLQWDDESLPSKQRKLVTSFRICVKIVSDCLLGLGTHPEFLSKLFLWTLRLTLFAPFLWDTFAGMNQIGSFLWQKGWFGACYYGNEFITSVVPSDFQAVWQPLQILPEFLLSKRGKGWK